MDIKDYNIIEISRNEWISKAIRITQSDLENTLDPNKIFFEMADTVWKKDWIQLQTKLIELERLLWLKITYDYKNPNIFNLDYCAWTQSYDLWWKIRFAISTIWYDVRFCLKEGPYFEEYIWKWLKLVNFTEEESISEVQLQKSPNWDKYYNAICTIDENLIYDEWFPEGGPYGNLNKVFEIISRTGEIIDATVDYSQQYMADGTQWKALRWRYYWKGDIIAWKEKWDWKSKKLDVNRVKNAKKSMLVSKIFKEYSVEKVKDIFINLWIILEFIDLDLYAFCGNIDQINKVKKANISFKNIEKIFQIQSDLYFYKLMNKEWEHLIKNVELSVDDLENLKESMKKIEKILERDWESCLPDESIEIIQNTRISFEKLKKMFII